ncbi:MAG: hypothetical protein WC360_05845 [Opitutales bacterium]|jgi:predicted transcriptional regulator
MVTLNVRPDLEKRLKEKLSSGMDANEIVEFTLNELAERDLLRQDIETGWQEADAGEFADSTPESVLRKARAK